MAGESAHFGLRQRSPMPAIRPFDLPPRLRSMLDQANKGLAQPFRGVGSDAIVAGLFPLARSGISTGSIVARQADPRATPGGVLCSRRRGMAKMVEYPPVADAARGLSGASRT